MVERILLFKWATGAILTVVGIIVPLVILIFTFSTFCSFALWAWVLIISAIFITPLAITRIARGGDALTSASDMKLWRLLHKKSPVTRIIDGEETVIENYYVTCDTIIKWYPRGYWNGDPEFYNVAEGIQKSHTIIIEGVKLIVV